MPKVKIIIAAVFAFGCLQLSAQHSFEWVDSATYQLYQAGEWKKLCHLDKEVSQASMDYYYNNMRVGIAYYHRMLYNKAIHFFERAHNDYPADPYAVEYLFWSEHLRGNEKDAYVYYTMLPDSIQARTDYKPKKIIESIYLEGGVKLSDSSFIANNAYYAQLGINHKLSPSFSLYHAYTYQRQKEIWGNYQQHQYYLAPTLHLKHQLSITLGFHYAYYRSTINFKDRFDTHSTSPPPVPGTIDTVGIHYPYDYGSYKENLLLSQATVSKTIKGFTIEPHLSVYVAWRNPNYYHTHTDSTIVDSFYVNPLHPVPPSVIVLSATVNDSIEPVTGKETFTEFIIGTGLYYDFGRVRIGADLNAVINKNHKTFIVSPRLDATVTKWLGISAFYMYKGYYPFALQEGYQLYNNFDKIKYKASLTTAFYIIKNLSLYLTYQFEGINDNFSRQDYHLHTLLIGLNFKL